MYKAQFIHGQRVAAMVLNGLGKVRTEARYDRPLPGTNRHLVVASGMYGPMQMVALVVQNLKAARADGLELLPPHNGTRKLMLHVALNPDRSIPEGSPVAAIVQGALIEGTFEGFREDGPVVTLNTYIGPRAISTYMMSLPMALAAKLTVRAPYSGPQAAPGDPYRAHLQRVVFDPASLVAEAPRPQNGGTLFLSLTNKECCDG